MRLMWPSKNIKAILAIVGKRLQQSATAPCIIASVIRAIQGWTSSIRGSTIRMILPTKKIDPTRFNFLECFAKSQVSNDIKTHKCESHHDINVLSAIFADSTNEGIDALRYQKLLLCQRSCRECMRKISAHNSMDLWVALTDNGTATICKASSVIEIAFYESKMALSEIVCLSRTELCWKKAHSAQSERWDLDTYEHCCEAGSQWDEPYLKHALVVYRLKTCSNTQTSATKSTSRNLIM